MSLSTLIAELPAPPVVRADSPPDENGLLQTSLPDHFHEIYAARLRGERVGAIAERFKCDRTTIWRKIKAVQDEFARHLETVPAFSIISEMFSRLRSLEEENRLAASSAKSERAKSMFLGNAQKALSAQADLLMSVGILERAPERLYKVIQTLKPIDPQELAQKQSSRTRQEIVSELIDRLGRATQL